MVTHMETTPNTPTTTIRLSSYFMDDHMDRLDFLYSPETTDGSYLGAIVLVGEPTGRATVVPVTMNHQGWKSLYEDAAYLADPGEPAWDAYEQGQRDRARRITVALLKAGQPPAE